MHRDVITNNSAFRWDNKTPIFDVIKNGKNLKILIVDDGDCGKDEKKFYLL